jgi:hypothetical protein
MQLRTYTPLLILAGFLGTACSRSDARVGLTQPTQFNGDSSVSVRATSTTALAEPVNNPICPMVAPFQVKFTVVVEPRDRGTVTVNAITLQFTDIAGVRMPQVTLAAPLPTAQIGTELVQTRGLTIPLKLGIGCGTRQRGTVRVTVDTRDQQGRQGSGMTTVSVN